MRTPKLTDTWASTTQAERARATRRARAVADYQGAYASGVSKKSAQDNVALAYGVSASSIQRWAQAKTPLEAERIGRPASAWLGEGAECAWTIYQTDYLRLEAPASMACYRRIQALAQVRSWQIPSEATFRRRLKDSVSAQAIACAREGTAGLLATHPRQQRSVANLAPLDWLCGDGRKHDLWVTPPAGGAPVRPVVWFWQDVYSRRMLGHRCGLSESADLVRLALSDVCTQHGVPHHVLIDNTRAVAAKWLSGGSRNRQRWHSSTEDVPGILVLLGIQVHHSGVERSAGGKGIGRGWAKPVERAFRDLAEAIDKHPLAAGAYTGRSPLHKPENYASKAISWAQFEALVADCVQTHNAQLGRRTEAAAGGSFDEAWYSKLETTPIKTLTTTQQALLLLAVETTKIKKDGTLTLKAGRGAGLPANRYYHPDLVAWQGKPLVARFDPACLHDGIHIYDTKGKYVCLAECILPVGFADTTAAKAHIRAQRQHRRAVKAELAAQQDMDSALLPDAFVIATPPTPPPQPGASKVLRLVPNLIDAPLVAENDKQSLRAKLAAGRRKQNHEDTA